MLTLDAHDQQTAELARHKLGRNSADDTDGYHRVTCPAVMSKIRCPLRPESMKLDRDRPEILTLPEHPQACCTQQTITVPPAVAAKTRQQHDYPSAAHGAVLQPAHQRRAGLRHHQGPSHHQHRPRLVPAHRPHPAHALDRLPARRPQPAHPRGVRRPPSRKHPPRHRRAPAQNPQAAPPDPRHARRPAITPPAATSPRSPPPASTDPATARQHAHRPASSQNHKIKPGPGPLTRPVSAAAAECQCHM